jgi:hypothetical protein
VATGQTSGGAIAAHTDVPFAGDAEWSRVSGISPSHPLVGGPRVAGLGAYDVDRGRSMIVTTPEGQMGPAAGGVAAVPDTPGIELVDTWRDLLNFKGSPMPWLLLFALVFLGLMSFRVQARAGTANRGVRGSLDVG